MNSTDLKLVNAVAEAWVNAGGDAEGIAWCFSAILKRVKEIIEERGKEGTRTTRNRATPHNN
jgi:hypothetical protein